MIYIGLIRLMALISITLICFKSDYIETSGLQFISWIILFSLSNLWISNNFDDADDHKQCDNKLEWFNYWYDKHYGDEN